MSIKTEKVNVVTCDTDDCASQTTVPNDEDPILPAGWFSGTVDTAVVGEDDPAVWIACRASHVRHSVVNAFHRAAA